MLHPAPDFSRPQARVWPGLAVEENNLQVQISALRKALGTAKDGQSCVVNVPGRGYPIHRPLGLG